MTHIRKNLVLFAGAGSLAVLLASCAAPGAATVDGSAGAALYDEFAALDESERIDAIVAAAEEEGEVVAYLRSDDVFGEIEEAFEAEYDIDLVIINPGTTQVVQQQLFEQASSGRVEADIVETYTHELNLMYADEEIVVPVPEFLAELAPDPSLASDFAIETFQYPFIPAWNTGSVSGADVPTSISDFTKPIWKDRTVLVTGYHPWYITAFQQLTQGEGMSISDFEKTMTDIAANSSTADSSNPASASIASGEYFGGPNIAMVAPQRLPDAPISYEPAMDPALVVPAGIGLLKGSKNPAAALLFSMWYLNEGSDILASEQYVEQNATEADLKDVEKVRPDISDLTTERLNDWRIAYDNLLKGEEPVLPEYVSGG